MSAIVVTKATSISLVPEGDHFTLDDVEAFLVEARTEFGDKGEGVYVVGRLDAIRENK